MSDDFVFSSCGGGWSNINIDNDQIEGAIKNRNIDDTNPQCRLDANTHGKSIITQENQSEVPLMIIYYCN